MTNTTRRPDRRKVTASVARHADGLCIDRAADSIAVWRDDDAAIDYQEAAQAIAADLGATTITTDGSKAIVWLRAPSLDLDNNR